MKRIFQLMLILMCMSHEVIAAQPDRTNVKTCNFKIIVQRIGVRPDFSVNKYTSMAYDEIIQDALKSGNLERASHSQKIEGTLKWISEDDNRVILDIIFERVVIDGLDKEPYVAHISIDWEESAVKVRIEKDLAEKKTIEPYSRAVGILNDLMLLNWRDGFNLEKKDSYVRPEHSIELGGELDHKDLIFDRKMIETAIFEERPWDLFRIVGPQPNKIKATLTTQEDGQIIASLNYFDYYENGLKSNQYEYNLKDRMATRATIVSVNSPMLKSENDIQEIVTKYLESENLEEYGLLGGRTIRTINIYQPG